jgi:hypothetical protein
MPVEKKPITWSFPSSPLKSPKALFVCASAFELLGKLADG